MEIPRKSRRKDETLDSFYRGRILVFQKKRGFRFSVDAPLLADFIRTEESDYLLELGTGCGIVSLLLSLKPFKHITALEIQKSLVDLARRNVKLNNLQKRITVIEADLRTFRAKRKYDVVFSNPPYIRKREGHLCDSLQKSIAKHELKCDIFDVMQKTAELMKEEGRAYFIFPLRRKEDFDRAVERVGIKIRALRHVVPRAGERANLFLAECGFTSQKEIHFKPLILFDESGKYTEEAEQIFRGRVNAETHQES